MRWSEIINEMSTAGATSAGNIATNVGGVGKGAIGVGFDPNGHKGIYDAAEKKKKKTEEVQEPVLLRR